MFDEARIEETVRGDLVESLYKQNAMTLIMAILLSGYLWFALKDVASPMLIVGWLLATNLITLARFLLALAYRRQPIEERRASKTWATLFIVGAGAAGVAWGALGTVLYPPSSLPHQLICISALLAISAVALFSLRVMFEAFAAIVIPTLLPGAVYISITGGLDETFTGMILGLFLVAGLVMAKRNAGDAAETLRLRYRLAAAVEAAQAASKAKGQFLAAVSHEIRTPINGVLGIAQILLRAARDPTTRHYLELLYSSGNHLLALINDILDFSKIEAGKLELTIQDFDLRQSVEEVTEVLEAHAREKGLRLLVHFGVDVPQHVRGDPVRLRQVLNNLIGNAIKFTETGFVTVTIKRSEADEDPAPSSSAEVDGSTLVLFDVSDTGIGIAPSDQARIFSAFSQADNSFSRKHGGTGLGLAISRQLVEAMGGRITLKSAPGQGSKFTFTASLAPARGVIVTGQRVDSETSDLPLAGEVLLVEDVELNRLVAKAMLESLGLAVQVAPDGQIALTLVTHEHFDAILMDVFLPVMDGLAATRAIREAEQSKGTARVPIIALTANASAEDRERCIGAGMDDYLTKPLRQEHLREMLKKWLPGRPAPRGAGFSGASSTVDAAALREVASENAQRLAFQLSRAVANGDLDTVAYSAHSLKSVGAHLEAMALSRACGALEAAARAGNAEAVRTLFDDVSSACRDVLTRLSVPAKHQLPGPPAKRNDNGNGVGSRMGELAKTAMVVDDEPNDQFFLRRILEGQGYFVKACWSGEAAVDACTSDEPDLIILDGRMPGMDGVETCRAIRAKCTRRVPIVVVTGVDDPAWRAAAYEAGADKILEKNVSIERLRSNLLGVIDSLPE